MNQEKVINAILDNMQRIFYPEEWIDIDLKLSKSELFAMLIVDRHGEVIMSKIADNVNVSMSTATGIVDRLVKKSYLKRERSESDRRVVVIKLTKKGTEVINALKESISHYINVVYNSITDEEIKVLNGIILKVIEAVNKDNIKKSEKNEEEPSLKSIDIE
ncbi:MAG: MarR family transcriptional regulator [Firmicutes bacterium]|nr:MarR family transcriptional regulator [Bacillota bacterium]